MKSTTFLLSWLSVMGRTFAGAVPVAEREIGNFDIMAEAEREPAAKNDFIDTYNDVVNGDCGSLMVIFARGTFESGNVGLLAGRPFFEALGVALPSDDISIQGIDYPADVGGYLEGGDPKGAATLASIAQLAVKKCPESQLILSCYSQGAQLIHLAAKQLNSSIFSKVKAVVVFGDTYRDQEITGIDSGRIKTICHVGDLICDGLPIPLPGHITYAADAIEAAAFIKQTTGA